MHAPILWLLLTASVFATNFAAIKVAVSAVPPLWLVVARLTLGALALWGFLGWRGELGGRWRELPLTGAIALF
ncbi:MAG: EamA family transporter, partial [Myxococcota bacterium]